jgi:hypothetical protein
MLLGPFVDMSHPDIASGEVFYMNPTTGQNEFVEFDELLFEIINIIDEELFETQTKVMLMPHIRDANTDTPIPQPPISVDFLKNTKMGAKGRFSTLSNP